MPGAIIASGHFKIEPEEALVVTIDPGKAQYTGFQLTDPWFRSVPYWSGLSSLSNLQARANADGSLTYVLSARDPGYHNWVSTGGLREGLILARIEVYAEAPSVGTVVRSVKLVKLGDLAHLPFQRTSQP